MDIEAVKRKELITALQPDFICFEEVPLNPALLPGRILRADVVAIPIEEQYWAYTIAFEVKAFDDLLDCSKWCDAIKQASDYVYAKTTNNDLASLLYGRRICASFVYPAPLFRPYVPIGSDVGMAGKEVMISGAFSAALHFRVCRAHWHERRPGQHELMLTMGPNELWRQNSGFTGQATPLLTRKRKLGSQMIDVLAELDGVGPKHLPFPEFE